MHPIAATTSPSRCSPRPHSTPAAPSRDHVALRILFIADVVGAPGRGAVETRLRGLRAELGVDACILNGENLADGVGITPRLADRVLAAGGGAGPRRRPP